MELLQKETYVGYGYNVSTFIQNMLVLTSNILVLNHFFVLLKVILALKIIFSEKSSIGIQNGKYMFYLFSVYRRVRERKSYLGCASKKVLSCLREENSSISAPRVRKSYLDFAWKKVLSRLRVENGILCTKGVK